MSLREAWKGAAVREGHVAHHCRIDACLDQADWAPPSRVRRITHAAPLSAWHAQVELAALPISQRPARVVQIARLFTSEILSTIAMAPYGEARLE